MTELTIKDRFANWLDAAKGLARPRLGVMLLLGFSAGLPFLLIFGTLSAWLREAGVSRTEIGFFSWVGLAYGFKFVWAPLLDQVRLPFIGERLGQRRSWMLLAQAGIIIGLIGIAVSDPSANLLRVAAFAVLVAFSSATQDIAVDAWRIEAAPKSEQGEMAAVYQLGYRFGLIAAGAGALYIADGYNWATAYFSMAALVFVGVLGVMLSPIVGLQKHAGAAANAPAALQGDDAASSISRWVYTAVIAPFGDFINRYKWTAGLILLLIATYRIPDFALGIMANPFYIDLGFTKSEIATVSKLYGIWVGIAGAFAGGYAVTRFSIMPTLLFGVIVGAMTNLFYVWLVGQGGNVGALTVAISAENFAGGFAGTALIAYMSMLTNRAFTATQYALFSSFFSLVAKFIAGFSGTIVDAFSVGADTVDGYGPFFMITAAAGVPAILCVMAIMRLQKKGVMTVTDAVSEPAADAV